MTDHVAERPEYAGDFEGTVHVEYTPHPDDGVADPGEIVWTWVPFEEDHHRGKDRPVLVVGWDAPYLLALILTSKDHDRDAADEARWGRVWLDIGSGAWDKEHRPSEIRLDRVLRIDPAQVRREGAVIHEPVFNEVAAGLHQLNRS
ncbi:type II toxin-antitoxin system PemK/MazF family toxin [Kribbella solani]|uniref:type II toxin-antitoxin system PemK/MazF family toxin n=1 Tax=Kribbella solani TaxID=236067 RepID=UPI0029AF9EE5|nr:type II toxin-antitoxin system PemK/MazF family toxin [Kribbella solani]MDX2971530.1 type II toxin-antitoxin system PemK/MazF family toxin [Kribbella solani]